MTLWQNRRMGPHVVNANNSKSSLVHGATIKPCTNEKIKSNHKDPCSQANCPSLGGDIYSERTVNDHDAINLEWTDKIQDCPVYRPSKEEFRDPIAYVQKIAPEASKYGICKIVSPLNASRTPGFVLMKENQGFKFATSVQHLRLTEKDMTEKPKFFMSGRKYNLRDFEKMANMAYARRFCCSGALPPSFIEKEFWTETSLRKKGTVEYAVNIDGSAFSCVPGDQIAESLWNMKKFSRQPKSPLRLVENVIPGVTEPMLYIGMLFSMFAWHVEDHFLNSINYHHCGATKTWYGVPGHAAEAFEEVALNHVYSQEIISGDRVEEASKLLAEKVTMFSPEVLLQHNVPVYKAAQMPGEFVVTFPRAYHAGFSQGFNFGEAVNFATGGWFPFGSLASELYAHLHTTPILSYEELLCKEAMSLYKFPKHDIMEHSAGELASQCCIKDSFIQLIQTHNLARWAFNRSRGSHSISHYSEGAILCSLCKRDCFIEHLNCTCGFHPVCIFHEYETLDFPCGSRSNCVLFLREDLSEMENAAQKFELEKGVEHDVQPQKTCEVDMLAKKSADAYSTFRPEKRNVKRTLSLTLSEQQDSRPQEKLCQQDQNAVRKSWCAKRVRTSRSPLKETEKLCRILSC